MAALHLGISFRADYSSRMKKMIGAETKRGGVAAGGTPVIIRLRSQITKGAERMKLWRKLMFDPDTLNGLAALIVAIGTAFGVAAPFVWAWRRKP